jgi:sulfide:quinone oxidoreductase
MKALSSDFSINPQVMPIDLASIAALGFKSIVCNRPDHETADQPSFSEIAVSASLFGIQAHYLPAASVSAIDSAQAEVFCKLMRELPTPTLAYCRTGLRSARFWELANAKAAKTCMSAT